MIIELPDSYEIAEDEHHFVRVRNGILEIQGPCDFEKLMINLTYQMKGKNRCCYCNKEFIPEKITIDHLFPTDFGEISITNNLSPACAFCNGRKSNLNEYEYRICQTLGNREEKNRFYHKTVAKKKKRKFSNKNKNGFDLPRSWVEYLKLDEIRKISKVNNKGSKKYKRILSFARRYNKLPRPLVLSRNKILLDGETVYSVAQELEFKKVPVIILENVVVWRN